MAYAYSRTVTRPIKSDVTNQFKMDQCHVKYGVESRSQG